MKITEDMIRGLQAKIEISYEEAERYLYKANGDVERAAFLYKEKQNSFWEKVKHTFRSFLKYRLRLNKKGKVILNIPIVSLLLFFLIDSNGQRLLILAIIAIAAIATECEFKVDKEPEDHEDLKGTTKKQTGSSPIQPKEILGQETVSHVVEKQETETYVEPMVTPPPVPEKQEVVVSQKPVVGLEPKASEINQEAPTKPQVTVEESANESYNREDSHDEDDDYYEFVIED